MKRRGFRVIERVLVLAASLLLVAQAAAQTDPLPSWNDGPAKKAIVEFVQSTTTNGNPKFVPPAERVATFDQDGTLWVEHPMYSQVMYCLDRVPALVEGEAGAQEGRAVQDGDVGQPRGDREIAGAGLDDDPRCDADRHVGRDVQC